MRCLTLGKVGLTLSEEEAHEDEMMLGMMLLGGFTEKTRYIGNWESVNY